MSTPEIDKDELGRLLERSGHQLTQAQIEAIMPGAAIFRRMVERVNAPLPREAEPALIFDVEQGR